MTEIAITLISIVSGASIGFFLWSLSDSMSNGNRASKILFYILYVLTLLCGVTGIFILILIILKII